MTLDDYRRSNRLTFRKLGHLLGVRHEHAWSLCRTQARPSPDLAARISAATQGIVTVEELLYPDGLPEGAQMSRDDDDAPAPPDGDEAEDGGGPVDEASAAQAA